MKTKTEMGRRLPWWEVVLQGKAWLQEEAVGKTHSLTLMMMMMMMMKMKVKGQMMLRRRRRETVEQQ